MKRWIWLLLFNLLLAGGVAGAGDAGFRCGADLIREGDIRSRVQ